MTSAKVERVSRRGLFARMRQSVVAIADAPSIQRSEQGSSKSHENPLMRDSIRIAGSGFTVYADGTYAVVLTAYHVVRDFVEDHRSVLQTGNASSLNPFDSLHVLGAIQNIPSGDDLTLEFFRAPFLAIQFSEILDVAAILVRDPSGEKGAELYPARISGDLPEDGDEIIACGFPLGHELFLREGYASAFSPSFSSGIVSAALPYPNAPLAARRYFRLNSIIHQGNSGSPVFDLLSGEVIGVVSTSFLEQRGAIRQPIGFAGATYALAAKGLIADVLELARRHKP